MPSAHSFPSAVIPAQKFLSFSAVKAATIVSLMSLSLLSACSKHIEKSEDIRPVRVVQAQLQGSEIATEIPGEVRPKIESRLGFRVAGKIVARKVELGTIVKRGQVLMQLDPQDLLLGQAQAKAAMSAAESNRDLAKAELKRYQDLREKNFVSQAVLDAKLTAFQAAQANFDQAKAGYSNQSNQAAYSGLMSDVDGVVTSIDAEVGQVVAAGTPVVRVAKTGDMDVVLGIPEDKINSVRQMKDVKIRLWANRNEVMTGHLRELSPIADPATRTYLAKIAIPAGVKDVRLGMTASVSLGMKNPQAMIRLPLTALVKEKEATAVWVVDAGTVRLVPVQIASTIEEDVFVMGGVQAGQMVVTAGVNQLKPGQKVTILGQMASAASASANASVIKATETASASGSAK